MKLDPWHSDTLYNKGPVLGLTQEGVMNQGESLLHRLEIAVTQIEDVIEAI